MKCPNCGGTAPEGARYCPYCNTYIKNANPPLRQRNAASAYRPDEYGEEAPRENSGSGKKIAVAVLALLLVAVLAIVVFFAVRAVKNRPNNAEITTEAPTTVTTAEPPTTEPTTLPAATDHFAEAKNTFFSVIGKISGYLGDPLDEFNLSDRTPEDDGSYDGYAYINNNYPDMVFAFTGSKNSDSAKLKKVYGKAETILPGRSNYTYEELKNILGDRVSAKKGSSGNYTVAYATDEYRVVFYCPYAGDLDAGLDHFRLEPADSRNEETEPETTKNTKEDEIKKDPEKYFAGNEKKTYTVSTEGDKLNVRAFAGTDNKIIGTVPNEAKLTVYGFYNGWAYVETSDGTKGWVSQNYLNRVE